MVFHKSNITMGNSFISVLDKLSLLKIDESFIFRKKDFERNDKILELSNLVIGKNQHYTSFNSGVAWDSNTKFEISHRSEVTEFYGYKETYHQLALILLNTLFNAESVCEVNLTHPKSTIKTLFISNEKCLKHIPFLEMDIDIDLKSFEYVPSKVDKFQTLHSHNRWFGFLDEQLPAFNYSFSNKDDRYCNVSLQKADQLVISVTSEGLCKLTELFLDIGSQDNNVDEICLEPTNPGFGGARRNSNEAKFLLPGSLAFPQLNLDNLFLPNNNK